MKLTRAFFVGGLQIDSARKKSTKINLLGPETAWWGGGLPLEGMVAENFVPALESMSSLGFEERSLGCPGNVAGMSRTPGDVQKVCAKKFVRIFRSLDHLALARWKIIAIAIAILVVLGQALQNYMLRYAPNVRFANQPAGERGRK